MSQWYERPLDQRAKPGGELGLDGKFYSGGEIMPFYVPRIEMPQINERDVPALLDYLEKIPVEVERRVVPSNLLKPHQRVSRSRVKGIIGNSVTLASPCLVSSDYYILDGNHRWWAHVETHTNVPVIVLGLPFEQAIGTLFEFPKTYVTQA